jgi:hypothetical protein
LPPPSRYKESFKTRLKLSKSSKIPKNAELVPYGSKTVAALSKGFAFNIYHTTVR